jgi:uncharacterized protein (UPF0548 family)
VFGLEFGSPTGDIVARSRAAAPTYDHVGSTLRDGPHAAAPRSLTEAAQVEARGQAFDDVKQALRSWQPQRAIGATAGPPAIGPDLGETVVFGFGVGPARLLAPLRIVAVVDEPDRYGYAYGTLPGHPLRGEELFLVEQTPEGLTVTIRVQAQPAGAMRFFAPLIHYLRRFALRRYLAALLRAARA